MKTKLKKIYIYILVNPLPGVETNVYLVCRFTGWMVGRRDDLLVCRLAKQDGCMDMNITSAKKSNRQRMASCSKTTCSKV